MQPVETAVDRFAEERIVASWRGNAEPWVVAVREEEIESRRLVTDRAVVEAVVAHSPRSVLDIGCGEGWLVRWLGKAGIAAVGVDVVPSLIEEAKNAGGGEFAVASFAELSTGRFGRTFDAAVCNFALIGKHSVERMVAAVPSLLNPDGVLIVQTLHPLVACGDLEYRNGWRETSWAGFSSAFTDPAPWYFRTLAAWLELFSASGLSLREMREPLHPKTHKPASVIFVVEARRR